MKIHLPPGTTSIEIHVSGSDEHPSVTLPDRCRRTDLIDFDPIAARAGDVRSSPAAGPSRLILGASITAALLLGGFTVSVLRPAPVARAAAAQQVVPTGSMPDPYQAPMASRQPAGADDVLRQLGTRPTVTPAPEGDGNAAPPKNPFGLE